MFKKAKKIKKEAEEIEKKFEKYRIRQTTEKAENLKLSFTLKPFSRYKLRVYGENRAGMALSSHGHGADQVVTRETIYAQGEFTIWKDGEKFDTYKFNKSGTTDVLGPTIVRPMKTYDFHPKEETKIKIEGTRYEGKLLGVELFKDIPQEMDLEAKKFSKDALDYLLHFKKIFEKYRYFFLIAGIVLISLIIFLPFILYFS